MVQYIHIFTFLSFVRFFFVRFFVFCPLTLGAMWGGTLLPFNYAYNKSKQYLDHFDTYGSYRYHLKEKSFPAIDSILIVFLRFFNYVNEEEEDTNKQTEAHWYDCYLWATLAGTGI